VQGNGQTELVEALAGLRAPAGGRVLLSGRDVTGAPPRALIDAGLSHIPEDRRRHGLVASYSIADNMVLCTHDRPPFARWGIRSDREVRAHAEALVARFDVRPPAPDAKAATLSGGNQQKVIIARELSRPVRLLIANQPTRGLDVGSIEYIHRAVVAARDGGAAVLLVSAELDEILALSDRIAVMYRGEIAAILDAAEATRERVGRLMAGARPGVE
ncbi:MAG: ATP-binding cassette domain-containing protein, partial [Polyangiaceae bacterium]|nr:ATP-binding cassette domain-containing protein [Polyangiaceae bacterium]